MVQLVEFLFSVGNSSRKQAIDSNVFSLFCFCQIRLGKRLKGAYKTSVNTKNVAGAKHRKVSV